MSGICGIFSFNAASPSMQEIELMNAALLFRGKDHVGLQCDGAIAMGCTLMRTTPQSLTESFPMRGSGNLVLTADARLDNRNELMDSLGLQETPDNPISDGALILASYLKWGETCAEHLLGDFAFALWDSQAEKLFCARDHFGIRPFCYTSNGRRFLFASEVSALIALPGVPKKVEERYLSDYLCKNFEEKRLTGLKDIFRLEPAHILVVDKNGESRSIRYWQADKNRELPAATDEEYIEGFRERLFTAVRRRLASTTSVASELTGGQDSSMIAAVAQQLLKERGETLKTFTNARPEKKTQTIDDMWKRPKVSDERPLVDMILRWCGLSEHTYITEPDQECYIETVRCLMKYKGYPQVSHYGEAAIPLYQAASRSGCRVLLSGLGGDQCVTGMSTGYYAEREHNAEWKTMFREAKGMSAIFGSSVLWNLVCRFFLMNHPALRVPLLRLFKGEKDVRRLDFNLTPITPTFAKRTDAVNRTWKTRATYIAGYPLPGKSAKDKDFVDMDWGYIPNSAEERSSSSLACGVECRFPLLDKELVEYVLALPRHMKVRDGWRRYIARRSMEGFLPPEAQWRKHKVGPGSIPYGKTQIVNNLNAIEEFLLKKEKDPLLMQYLNGATLAKNLAQAKRADFIGGQMSPGPIRQGVALALFLETMEK